jgi:hypothetical protein
MTSDATSPTWFRKLHPVTELDFLEHLPTLEETTVGRETRLRVPERGRAGSSRARHGDVRVSRPADLTLDAAPLSDSAAAENPVAENPTRAWLDLLDLTMAKLEEAVAAFEKERNAFEKWANDERAAIARERARRGRWFRKSRSAPPRSSILTTTPAPERNTLRGRRSSTGLI